MCDRDGIFLLDLQTKQARRLLAVPGQRFITFTETGNAGNVWLLSFRQ